MAARRSGAAAAGAAGAGAGAGAAAVEAAHCYRPGAPAAVEATFAAGVVVRVQFNQVGSVLAA